MIWRTFDGWHVEEPGCSPVCFSEGPWSGYEVSQNYAVITPEGGVATADMLDSLVREGKPLMGQDLDYPEEGSWMT